ncbi:nicotinamide-nucleotide amidohydrolase family protein [Nocardia brasiliensis]|uniref:Nicotinamide-nucleotide amidohydrolase family protein n=1 Tax=Nocardia brasiliensis TaxID=37326 RepID=A0A6G9XSE3_NOCBR|nr:CinA family protein [Nocardia brasiliensis]QIS03780.1 nicotinamide-nucleotide amidohydrolase family protein [Nocardia brasiliensis]
MGTSNLAERIAAVAQRSGRTVAVAESLTAGRLAAALGAAPEAGAWFHGGVVAYSRFVKHSVLDVPEGPVVSRAAAESMARTVRTLTGATVACAVTGAGGPDPQDDQPPGTVWFAVATEAAITAERKHFPGDPGAVLDQTVAHALELLLDALPAA